MPPGTTAFPAALDSLSTLVEVRDLASTTLTAPVDDNDTTFPVASTGSLPSTGIVSVEGEHVVFTSKDSSNLLGLSRGAFTALGGSNPTAHDVDTPVEILQVAASHMVHSQALVNIETKLGIGASVPALGLFLVGSGAGSSGWTALTGLHVTTALDFTPANIAGDTFTGGVAIDDGAGSVANAGSVRLRNTGDVVARNAAGTANVPLVSLDASDVMQLRNGAATLNAAGLLSATSLGATTITAAGSLVGSQAVIGANPAQSGAVRIPNNAWITARNAANNADVDMIQVNAAGSVVLGNTPLLTNPTLVTPTIASFANALHTHQAAASGGVLPSAAITAALGYTPANAAGQTFTGNLTVAAAGESNLTLNSAGTNRTGVIRYVNGDLKWHEFIGSAVEGYDYIIWNPVSGSTFFIQRATGLVGMGTLIGTGTRAVEASATGLLSATNGAVKNAGILTIATDAITLPAITPVVGIIDVRLETEAAAATDNLTTITPTGEIADGTILQLRTNINSHDVTIVAGSFTNQIKLPGGTSIALTSNLSSITLRRAPDIWLYMGHVIA